MRNRPADGSGVDAAGVVVSLVVGRVVFTSLIVAAVGHACAAKAGTAVRMVHHHVWRCTHQDVVLVGETEALVALEGVGDGVERGDVRRVSGGRVVVAGEDEAERGIGRVGDVADLRGRRDVLVGEGLVIGDIVGRGGRRVVLTQAGRSQGGCARGESHDERHGKRGAESLAIQGSFLLNRCRVQLTVVVSAYHKKHPIMDI